MNPQTELQLDFTIPAGGLKIHQRENNSESQDHLEENKKHFHKQCRDLLELYKKGIRLTRITAATEYGIRSLERRHKDLKDAGEDVKEAWVMNDKGKKLYKEYYY